jgi:hypothetical protein
MFVQRIIHFTFVVNAIGGKAINVLFYLFQ